MEITIRPDSGFNAEIRMGDGQQSACATDTISLMENAKSAGYNIRVELRASGYTLNSEIESAALELAGLSGFAAAKQTSKGYIEF